MVCFLEMGRAGRFKWWLWWWWFVVDSGGGAGVLAFLAVVEVFLLGSW